MSCERRIVSAFKTCQLKTQTLDTPKLDVLEMDAETLEVENLRTTNPLTTPDGENLSLFQIEDDSGNSVPVRQDTDLIFTSQSLGIDVSAGSSGVEVEFQGTGAQGLDYKGTWDATANNPFLQSSVGNQGDYYVVSEPGSTDLNGITDWEKGDWATFNGTIWEKIDNTQSLVTLATEAKADRVTLTATNSSGAGTPDDILLAGAGVAGLFGEDIKGVMTATSTPGSLTIQVDHGSLLGPSTTLPLATETTAGMFGQSLATQIAVSAFTDEVRFTPNQGGIMTGFAANLPLRTQFDSGMAQPPVFFSAIGESSTLLIPIAPLTVDVDNYGSIVEAGGFVVSGRDIRVPRIGTYYISMQFTCSYGSPGSIFSRIYVTNSALAAPGRQHGLPNDWRTATIEATVSILVPAVEVISCRLTGTAGIVLDGNPQNKVQIFIRRLD